MKKPNLLQVIVALAFLLIVISMVQLSQEPARISAEKERVSTETTTTNQPNGEVDHTVTGSVSVSIQ